MSFIYLSLNDLFIIQCINSINNLSFLNAFLNTIKIHYYFKLIYLKLNIFNE